MNTHPEDKTPVRRKNLTRFGVAFYAICDILGVTATWVAEQAGLRDSTLSMATRKEKNKPSEHTIALIFTVFEAHPGWENVVNIEPNIKTYLYNVAGVATPEQKAVAEKQLDHITQAALDALKRRSQTKQHRRRYYIDDRL